MSTQPVGPWARDDNAYDPGVTVRHVDVDGRLFEVRNVSGPGWSMVVRPVDNPHVSGMARWENWDDVTAAAHHCIEAETARGRD